MRKLKAGDMVLLSGTVFTGRDEVHKYLYKGGDLPVLQDGVIYHCGPVVLEEKGELPRRRGRADDVDPRGAVPGGRHRALRHQGGDRQGRHGRQDAAGVQGARLRLPARHRRRGADLRPLRRGASRAST